jgi:hypothetical protein
MNRYDDRHRDRDRHRLRDLRDVRRDATGVGKRGGLAAKVFGIILVVGIAGFAVSRFASKTADVQPLPPKKPLAGLKAKELQQQASQYGIEGGARAGMDRLAADERINKQITAGDAAAVPEPKVVTTNSGYVVRGVRSENPYVLPRDRRQAVDDALAVARQTLIEKGGVPPGKWSLAFDPDSEKDRVKVREITPTKEVKDRWVESGLEADRGWVEIEEVTLTHDSLRQERATGRTAEAGFWFGTVFLVLLAGYGFLRLDLWTKGYLTLVLGLIVGVVTVAAVLGLGLLVF